MKTRAIQEKLMGYKEKIANAKVSIAKHEGKIDTLMETLQKDFGCDSVKGAEKLISKNKKKASKLESEIEELVESIDEHFQEG